MGAQTMRYRPLICPQEHVQRQEALNCLSNALEGLYAWYRGIAAAAAAPAEPLDDDSAEAAVASASSASLEAAASSGVAERAWPLPTCVLTRCWTWLAREGAACPSPQPPPAAPATRLSGESVSKSFKQRLTQASPRALLPRRRLPGARGRRHQRRQRRAFPQTLPKGQAGRGRGAVQ